MGSSDDIHAATNSIATGEGNGDDRNQPNSSPLAAKPKQNKDNTDAPKRRTSRQQHTCNECGKSFKRSSYLKKHREAIHHSTRRYICDICNERFTRHLDIDIHMRTHSSGNDHSSLNSITKQEKNGTESKPYACDQCDKCYGRARFLKRHKMTIHLGIRPFVCNMCDMSFAECSPYKKHFLRHCGEKPYACTSCSKSFTTNFEMKRHKMAVHDGIRTHACNQCAKVFARKSDLRTHKMFVHERIRRFGCDLCGKRFCDKASLVYHLGTHSKVKPYACDQCKKAFPNLISLKKHRNRIHR